MTGKPFNVNCTYSGAAPNSAPMTLTLCEPPMGDSAEYVEAFPAASGKDICDMMTFKGIKITDAARVFDISQKIVRKRRLEGTNAGLHSWEWMRWLPYRYRTLRQLSSSASWLPYENRREVKVFRFKHYRFETVCMGVKLDPGEHDGGWQEPYTLSKAGISTRKDAGPVLFFGRIDAPPKVRGKVKALPVMSRDPLDHVRAYGSIDLMIAHLFVQEHWDVIESGAELDGVWLSHAYDGPTPSKADLDAADIADALRMAS